MIILVHILSVLQTLILIRVVLTWIMPGRLPEPIRIVADPIDRVLKFFQVLIPMGPAYLDLGPLLCLLLLQVIQRVLISMMYAGAVPAF